MAPTPCQSLVLTREPSVELAGKAKLDELGIPVIRGRITQTSGTVATMTFEELLQHKAMMPTGSLALLDIRKNADGEVSSVSARIRLGHTDTWLAAHVDLLPPDKEIDTSLDVGDEGDDNPLHDSIYAAESEATSQLLADIAAAVATSDGFGAVALRDEPRQQFTMKVMKKRFAGQIDLGPFMDRDRIAYQAARMARDYWEFYVIPIRAKALQEQGKTAAQIAKALSITKQRAERALELAETIGDDINSPVLLPLIRKYIDAE